MYYYYIKLFFLERKYFYQNMFVFIVTKIHKCNILCKQTTQKQIEPTWVFVNVDLDVHTIMYFQFAISRNISQDKILFVLKRASVLLILEFVCSYYNFRWDFALEFCMFICFYLFTDLFLRLQMFMLAYCHIFQFFFRFVCDK